MKDNTETAPIINNRQKETDTLINQKETVILLNSDAINSFPSLKSLLLKHKKITRKIINEATDLDDKTKKLIDTKAYREIYYEARKEWIAMSDYEIGVTKCSLCNHKNHQIFYIKNTLNGNVLNVGSECVTHFPNLKTEDNIEISQLIKREKKIRVKALRRKKFSEKFPNLSSRLARYRSFVNHSPYLVNYILFTKFNSSIDKIKKLQSDYLNCKGTDKYLLDISSELEKIEQIVDTEIPKCNELLKKERFACTKEISDWLKKNDRDDVIEQIRKENSVITSNTINFVAYLPFVEELLDDYRKILKPVIKMITIDKRGNNLYPYIYIRFDNKYIETVSFYCKPEAFMGNLGRLVFLSNFSGSLELKMSDYLYAFELENTEMNVVEVFSILNQMFFTEYQFLCSFKRGDFNLGEFFILDLNNNTFYETKSVNYIAQTLFRYLGKGGFKYLCKNNFFSLIRWREISESDKERINECREWMQKATKIDNEYY